jgi:hypothetical protein
LTTVYVAWSEEAQEKLRKLNAASPLWTGARQALPEYPYLLAVDHPMLNEAELRVLFHPTVTPLQLRTVDDMLAELAAEEGDYDGSR